MNGPKFLMRGVALLVSGSFFTTPMVYLWKSNHHGPKASAEASCEYCNEEVN